MGGISYRPLKQPRASLDHESGVTSGLTKPAIRRWGGARGEHKGPRRQVAIRLGNGRMANGRQTTAGGLAKEIGSALTRMRCLGWPFAAGGVVLGRHRG